MTKYELKPTNGQKSFYGKAIVEEWANGKKVLYSYKTPIIEKNADGSFRRLYSGWTATTGKHIKSFCGLSKKEFLSLPYRPHNIIEDITDLQEEYRKEFEK